MTTYYCPGNNPFTCIFQTILGLLPFASLFYFYWIINKYIKAEGYSLQMPPYQLTHVLKLVGSCIFGALSLARLILEIAMGNNNSSILLYIIYSLYLIISVVITYLIRQEYNFLGYSTPFLRTFLLFFESCYALMLILSEIFPNYENDTTFTAKEVIQVLILSNNLILLIICFAYKSDTKSNQHEEIADFGFKLRKKYSSSLIKKVTETNNQVKDDNDLEKQLLRQSIISDFLSQTSGPSQLKTIQSNEFSYFDGNISKLYKVNLEVVGIQSIKVTFEEQVKDEKSKKQNYIFKIQVKTKTEENHETLRNLTEFINYINDVKSFLSSLQYILNEVKNFDQKTKDKNKINQLALNLEKILKYIVENNYMNSYFYQLTKSNSELIQYGKENSLFSHDHQHDAQDKRQSSEIKESESENKKEKKNKKNKKPKQKENNPSKVDEIQIDSKNQEQLNLEQIKEQQKEESSLEAQKLQQQIENEQQFNNEKDDVNPQNQNKYQNDEDIEESKENNELQLNQKDLEQYQNPELNQFERSQSFNQTKQIEESDFQLITQRQSNQDTFQRSQSIMPTNLVRNSHQQNQITQKSKEISHQSEFFQVQFIESKQVDNFTAYVYKIKERQSRWESVIQKRYSQFEKLHNLLKPIAKAKKIILPNLPYKNEESGLFTSNKNQNLIEFRSKELKNYLQKLLLEKGFKKEQILLEFINFEKIDEENQNKK
ncbi:PX domain protein (macronuclear) [Tetrahymena thermophila SB210]|uniref:PX domain protein n=1 Tax=Tetrahymena thermophila (strain SB210) TaxID=312017 RepID=Q23DH2_TETTS|nr:PX domain protein [Tetrahymena thermophila SB210]EAR94623.2 PX domain protein [Tetrahymena thermophila SB210]|eukprot:XP_001014714.2 PX domain protein [Tetrahymena thermophila SB210]